METSGFSCIALPKDDPGGEGHPARAAFITEASVNEARRFGGRLEPEIAKRAPDLRYGDLLVVTEGPGGPRGRHVRAGRDAGLVMEIPGADGYPRRVPFTGASMMRAREALLAAKMRAKAQVVDHERALQGINGVFEVICVNPDPDRFSPDQIGQAYLCGMFEAAGSLELSVTAAEFGRKSRADMIRAQISRMSRVHPDGLFHVDDLGMMLSTLGIEPDEGEDKFQIGQGAGISPSAIRRMISSNPQLREHVFGALTATKFEAIEIMAISASDYDTIIDEFDEYRLEAQWVDLMRSRVESVLSSEATPAKVGLELMSIDGRDIMLMRESANSISGMVLLCSWTSVDRLSVSEIGAHRHLLVAPAEIPSEADIKRLAATLSELRLEAAMDVEQRQMRA